MFFCFQFNNNIKNKKKYNYFIYIMEIPKTNEMNINDIIENIGKYHYILATLKKAKILSNGNKDKETKKEANNMIKQLGDKMEDKYITKLKLSKISKKILKENDESEIKTVGGPIKIDIIFYQINNLKIKKLIDFPLNNTIYITKKFLDNNHITDKILKKIAIITLNKKLSNKLFVINNIDKFTKK